MDMVNEASFSGLLKGPVQVQASEHRDLDMVLMKGMGVCLSLFHIEYNIKARLPSQDCEQPVDQTPRAF